MSTNTPLDHTSSPVSSLAAEQPSSKLSSQRHVRWDHFPGVTKHTSPYHGNESWQFLAPTKKVHSKKYEVSEKLPVPLGLAAVPPGSNLYENEAGTEWVWHPHLFHTCCREYDEKEWRKGVL